MKIKVVSPSKKCILVGHDWGGVIGWWVVIINPRISDCKTGLWYKTIRN
jgi:pimeloyl-ACP methyl ester carboxylesterase